MKVVSEDVLRLKALHEVRSPKISGKVHQQAVCNAPWWKARPVVEDYSAELWHPVRTYFDTSSAMKNNRNLVVMAHSCKLTHPVMPSSESVEAVR